MPSIYRYVWAETTPTSSVAVVSFDDVAAPGDLQLRRATLRDRRLATQRRFR